MDNAIMILQSEKEILEEIRQIMSEKFQEVCAPALVQTPSAELEDVMDSYIDLDKFTPEQREEFDRVSELFKDARARLNLCDRYVKSRTSSEVIESYDQSVEPLENYNELKMHCNNIALDQDGNFSKYSIKIGPVNVESPERMTYEEFSQLYTTSLDNILARCYVLNADQAREQIQASCTEVYLSQKPSTMTL